MVKYQAVTLDVSCSWPKKSATGCGKPRYKCLIEGCEKRSQIRGLCREHGGHNRGVACNIEGCPKRVLAKGLCIEHGGGTPCAYEGCFKYPSKDGHCLAHWNIVVKEGGLEKFLKEREEGLLSRKVLVKRSKKRGAPYLSRKPQPYTQQYQEQQEQQEYAQVDQTQNRPSSLNNGKAKNICLYEGCSKHKYLRGFCRGHSVLDGHTEVVNTAYTVVQAAHADFASIPTAAAGMYMSRAIFPASDPVCAYAGCAKGSVLKGVCLDHLKGTAFRNCAVGGCGGFAFSGSKGGDLFCQQHFESLAVGGLGKEGMSMSMSMSMSVHEAAAAAAEEAEFSYLTC